MLVVADSEPFLGPLKEGLGRLGYVEGQNLQIELRTAEGKIAVLPTLAEELVRLKVDILVAWQTPAVQAAKQATAEIPIVMSAGDPVATGLVASLARPGGNVTGVTGTTAALGGKIIELIRETLPAARRVAVLANVADPFMQPFLEQIQQAGRVTAMVIRSIVVRGADEFAAAFSEMEKWRAQALVVQPSLPRSAAIRLAMKHRLPSISPLRAFAEAGGLMSYAASTSDLYRSAAAYVDKILRGAKPADLPVQQASTFELVINLKTAKALGITVPRSLLLRADRVVE